MANVILRLPVVKARTGLSRSTIYLHMTDGSFPRPVSLGARAIGWVESDVESWISRKIEESKQWPRKLIRDALPGGPNLQKSDSRSPRAEASNPQA